MFKARQGLKPGQAAEDQALEWLLRKGLRLEQRNYRVARGPSARGGEIDLVMRDTDGTLVFVEPRAWWRSGQRHPGQAAQPAAGRAALPAAPAGAAALPV